MGKNPAFQFYVRDWLSDPQLKMVSFQTKGIWIDFLCYLWESPDRGTLSSTPEKFCQMLGCGQLEWEQFLQEASVTKFASVTNCNGIVTVENRRMYREEKERRNTRLRVERYREKRECNATSNANITVPSSSSSSTSNIINANPPVDNSKKIQPPKDSKHLYRFCSQCHKETLKSELEEGRCLSCLHKDRDIELARKHIGNILKEI